MIRCLGIASAVDRAARRVYSQINTALYSARKIKKDAAVKLASLSI